MVGCTAVGLLVIAKNDVDNVRCMCYVNHVKKGVDMGYDKNTYNKAYKKEHFDQFNFYAPKGTKAKVEKRAQEKGMKVAEYLRYLIDKDTQ